MCGKCKIQAQRVCLKFDICLEIALLFRSSRPLIDDLEVMNQGRTNRRRIGAGRVFWLCSRLDMV
jgi:hypothetical protein